jgi:diguanylate cyclase (GGDEF)-like protein
MRPPSAPSRYRLLAASLLLGAVLVIADAAMDAYVDLWDRPRPEASWGERFLEELLNPSLREIWIRSFVLLLCVGFGAFAVLERQRSERHLATLAYRDALTGLPNRADFSERLAAEIGHAQRHHRAFALIFLDLDHFKVVNDSLGHDRGDDLLRAVAHRLSTALRPEDLLARLGGDEFVLLVRSVASPFDITALAQRLIDLLAQPFVIDGKEVFLGASAGISLFPENGADASNLIRRADAAMYHAKGCGRNNVRFYTAELNARLGERSRMQGELRKALQLGEFELDYRPQLALPGREIVGTEAVLRWRREG